MAEMRWNPILGTYTLVASNRQNRPHMPKDYCPFCPGSGNVPDDFDVFCYDNDFPVLSETPDEVKGSHELFRKQPAYGKCEVILYSPDHNARLQDLSDNHIHKLVQLWTERFIALKADKKIKYIYPFENKGEEVGVTMPHPHGQLYAFSFVPQKIEIELQQSRNYFKSHRLNMWDEMMTEEKNEGKRILFETESFLVYLPFFTDYPYGLFIVSKKNRLYLSDFKMEEQRELALVLKEVVGTFDCLFDRSFPYMMAIHQGVVNEIAYKDAHDYYRFHIEFYPPLRTKEKMKYYASVEMGTWAAANVIDVETSILDLRNARKKYLNSIEN